MAKLPNDIKMEPDHLASLTPEQRAAAAELEKR